jgi:hypothetical protein
MFAGRRHRRCPCPPETFGTSRWQLSRKIYNDFQCARKGDSRTPFYSARGRSWPTAEAPPDGLRGSLPGCCGRPCPGYGHPGCSHAWPFRGARPRDRVALRPVRQVRRVLVRQPRSGLDIIGLLLYDLTYGAVLSPGASPARSIGSRILAKRTDLGKGNEINDPVAVRGLGGDRMSSWRNKPNAGKVRARTR